MFVHTYTYLYISETTIIKEKRLSPGELVRVHGKGGRGRRSKGRRVGQKLMHSSLIKLYLKIKTSQSALCGGTQQPGTVLSVEGRGHCHMDSRPLLPFQNNSHGSALVQHTPLAGPQQWPL